METAVLALKFLALLIVSFPVIMVLRVIGEYIGIAASLALGPIFFIPIWMRLPCILFLAYWLLVSFPLYPLLFIIFFAGVAVQFIYNVTIAGQNSSLEWCALGPLSRMYVLQICYLYSLQWSSSLLIQLIFVIVLSAGPMYFIRSLQRTYIVAVNAFPQWRRDKFAKKVIKNISKFKTTRFALYLRPFEFDKEAGSASSAEIWSPIGYGRFSGNVVNESNFHERIADIFSDNMEHVLARSLDRYCKLIAAGPNREGWHLGAGKVELLEGSWQEKLASMIENSKYIFIVPSMNPGTLWELQYIQRHGHIDKTIFIMLADKSEDIVSVVNSRLKMQPSSIDNYRTWSNVNSETKLHLPPYRGDRDWLCMRSRNGSFVFTRFDSESRGNIGLIKTLWSVLTTLHAQKKATIET